MTKVMELIGQILLSTGIPVELMALGVLFFFGVWFYLSRMPGSAAAHFTVLLLLSLSPLPISSQPQIIGGLFTSLSIIVVAVTGMVLALGALRKFAQR
ncbi:hypothetical protein LCGC14_1280420 [marine sediment metagenome]|uniref:Uncharacterized protein n=1 Tax=marine sediment metagenome TaxID=412755 RepID=A0A0F9NC23_9ZZZZ